MADERDVNEVSGTVPAEAVRLLADGRLSNALGTTEGMNEGESAPLFDTAVAEVLPGDEVSVLEDPELTHGVTDPRGIMERIVDTVLHDDNEYIDYKAGPSI